MFVALSRLLAIFLLIVLPETQIYGQASSEPEIKAAYLVNFLKYVEWPEAGESATICLFGRDTMGSYLSSYEGRLIAGRELRVRRLYGPSQVAECHAIFISETEEQRFSTILHWVESLPILTVSDTEAFTRYGGAIALIRADGRLQFDINVDALSRAGLKPSSPIMRLARKVIGGTR